MAWMHPDAIEYRRRRFTRTADGYRYVKPDPERWLSPEELRLEHPDLYERKYGSVLRRPERPAPLSQLDIIRSDETLRLHALHLLRGAQVQIAMLRHELALRRKYNPDQPRVRRATRTAASGRAKAIPLKRHSGNSNNRCLQPEINRLAVI